MSQVWTRDLLSPTCTCTGFRKQVPTQTHLTKSPMELTVSYGERIWIIGGLIIPCGAFLWRMTPTHVSSTMTHTTHLVSSCTRTNSCPIARMSLHGICMTLGKFYMYIPIMGTLLFSPPCYMYAILCSQIVSLLL